MADKIIRDIRNARLIIIAANVIASLVFFWIYKENGSQWFLITGVVLLIASVILYFVIDKLEKKVEKKLK